MQFNLPISIAVLLIIIVVGIGGLVQSGVMEARTVLVMVAPSMIVFGLVAFALGVKHGQFRAGRA